KGDAQVGKPKRNAESGGTSPTAPHSSSVSYAPHSLPAPGIPTSPRYPVLTPGPASNHYLGVMPRIPLAKLPPRPIESVSDAWLGRLADRLEDKNLDRNDLCRETLVELA